MTLFGNKVFGDAIKQALIIQYHLCPHERRRGKQEGGHHVKTETQEEGHVMTETETGVMQQQAQERRGCAATPEARQRQEGFSPTGFRGSTVLRILDSGLPVSKTMKE